MAAPSGLNNNMLMLLYEQCKENRDLYKQQQTTLDRLTQAIGGLAQKRDFSQLIGQDSDCGSVEDVSVYDNVTSDEEPWETDGESSVKRLKLSTQNDCDIRLQRLKNVESQFTKKEEYGPNVHDGIASIVNKGLSEPVDHKSASVQELLQKYQRPENCEYLEVPKVNRVLWSNKQTGKDLKQGDKLLQRVQNYMTKAMTPLINVINKTLVMEAEEAKEIFDMALDSFNMLAFAHRDFSNQRRRLLLPAISARYASLCRDSEKFMSPTQLFGDDKDLERRIKEIDESKKLGHTFTFVPSGSGRPSPTEDRMRKWGSKAPGPRTPTATASRAFLGKRTSPNINTINVQRFAREIRATKRIMRFKNKNSK